jgi:hypothetical protein
MTMTLRLLVVLAALASGCSFEADLSEVEITQHGVKVPGKPGSGTADQSASASFAFSKAASDLAKSINRDVQIHQIAIAASGGVPNLTFIKSMHVTMATPSNPDLTVELLSYDRTQSESDGWDIQVTMPVPIDVTATWVAARTEIEIEMAGRLPQQDWAVDVTLTFSGKITYEP